MYWTVLNVQQTDSFKNKLESKQLINNRQRLDLYLDSKVFSPSVQDGNILLQCYYFPMIAAYIYSN